MKVRTLLILSVILVNALLSIAQSDVDDATVFRVCGKKNPESRCATPPKLIYDLEAEYPRKARKDGIQGTVVLEAIVGADGVPSRIAVTKSLRADLDKSAVSAVKRWRFSPGTYDEKAVAVKINVEVNFRIFRPAVHSKPSD